MRLKKGECFTIVVKVGLGQSFAGDWRVEANGEVFEGPDLESAGGFIVRAALVKQMFSPKLRGARNALASARALKGSRGSARVGR